MVVASAVLARRLEVKRCTEREGVYEKRRARDAAYLKAWAVAEFTVAIPTIIGALLHDTILLPTKATAPAVVRNFMRGTESFGTYVRTYFLSDYLTGFAIFAAIVAIALLARAWPGRRLGVSRGFGFLAGCLIAHFAAVAWWDKQEDALSASKIFAYPYSTPGTRIKVKLYSTCGMSNVIELDGHNYYVWTGNGLTATDRKNALVCFSVHAYSDWDEIRSVDGFSQDGESVSIDVGSAGTLCDTDGTVAGLIWFARQRYETDRYVVPLSAVAPVHLLSFADFSSQYPMCRT
jgi:hypothetical protein